MYYDFDQYSGAVLVSAVMSILAQVEAGQRSDRNILRSLKASDVENQILSRMKKQGCPTIKLNFVFGIGNTNVCYGFSRDDSNVSDVSAFVVAADKDAEHLSAHHVVLHTGPTSTFKTTHTNHKQVTTHTVTIPSFDRKAINETTSDITSATLTVQKIGIRCKDADTLDTMLAAVKSNLVTFLLHLVINGSHV